MYYTPKLELLVKFSDITVPNTDKETTDPEWNENGVKILDHYIPDVLIDEYIEERKKLLLTDKEWQQGWPNPTPYMQCKSMLHLATCLSLTSKIKRLIHDHQPGLHLCLTGFKSTERAFHQDRYLNPDLVGDHYIAAWIALDDIHPDSGPFEYVAGSHKWPVIVKDRVLNIQKANYGYVDDKTWPSDTQGWVGAACEEEIKTRGAEISQFIPKKGDVLLWHASLIHRGSKPNNPNLERRSLICHYSSIDHRPDMPDPIKKGIHGHYFPIDTSDQS